MEMQNCCGIDENASTTNASTVATDHKNESMNNIPIVYNEVHHYNWFIFNLLVL